MLLPPLPHNHHWYAPPPQQQHVRAPRLPAMVHPGSRTESIRSRAYSRGAKQLTSVVKERQEMGMVAQRGRVSDVKERKLGNVKAVAPLHVGTSKRVCVCDVETMCACVCARRWMPEHCCSLYSIRFFPTLYYVVFGYSTVVLFCFAREVRVLALAGWKLSGWEEGKYLDSNLAPFTVFFCLSGKYPFLP